MLEEAELIEPELWDNDCFVNGWEPVYRYASSSGRLYYRKTEEGLVWYMSVTNAIKKVVPPASQLIDWMIQNGKDGAEKLSNSAAEYGTMMHIFNAKFLIDGHYNFDMLDHDIKEYIDKYPPKYADLLSSKKRLLKDMLSFAKFCFDYEVVVRAIEVIVYDDDMQLAGAIDIICEMNDKNYSDKTPKSQRKKVAAIIDEKSGGIWDSYGIQLELYRRMWNKLHPYYPIFRIANWAPKDWRGTSPTYTYKPWNPESDPMISCIDEYVSILKKQHAVKPFPEISVKGKIKLGVDPDPYITLETYNA